MSCFGAWLQGAGDKKTFNEYLQAYGLGDKKKKLTKKQKKQIASKGVRTAQRILRMKSKRREKRGKKSI